MGRVVRNEACPICQSNGRDTRGDNLAVYEDNSKYCFSCHSSFLSQYYIPKPKVNDGPKSLCPGDLTREIPGKALKWLLQFGLHWDYWKESVSYSPHYERLVFEVRNGHNLVFSIGRYFGSNKDPKWFVWGDCHKHCEVVNPTGLLWRPTDERENRPIVLVEDLISAHKVGQVATCVPLFGTKVHPCHYYYLMQEQRPIVLWLDKDQEYNVKRLAMHIESIVGQPIQINTTKYDPKLLAFDDIYNEIYHD